MTIKPRLHRSRVLRKCGFKRKDSGRAPEEKYILEVAGKGEVMTSVPHGNKDLKRGTSKAICNQLYLRKNEYRGVYSCSISREQYYELVKNRIA